MTCDRGRILRSRVPGAERKVVMAVLKQHHTPGMPADAYDQVAAEAMPSQRKADGFVAHYAIVEDGGTTVIEDLGLDRPTRRLVRRGCQTAPASRHA